MKVIAFYLPQYHETEENNRWWGKGYTDWNATRDAIKYSHLQDIPRVPLNQNYYNLDDESGSAMKWQAELANKYGIYGFCFYHYWFHGKRMLEKPIEILRKHPEIHIHYSLCWDNNEWKRNWYADKHEKEILIPQDYGDKEIWKNHFMDILPDFQDERYIKIDNKPVFHIYHARKIPCLNEMKLCWDDLAKEYGFAGVYLVVSDIDNRGDEEFNCSIDAYYNYEPVHAYQINIKKYYGMKCVLVGGIRKRINKLFKTNLLPYIRDAKGIYRCIEKDTNKTNKKTYYGIFSSYDDTPRRQKNGVVYVKNSLEIFEKTLKKQIEKSWKDKNEFLYITAWNEWGESAYLEPDVSSQYGYLETIAKALEDTKERE